MSTPDKPPVRRADASRNDTRILAAARAIFSELGPDAPVSVIAERAGVGMGTLYRRYPSKSHLMRELSLADMDDTRQAAEAAVQTSDSWAGLTGFIDTCVEAGVDGSPRLTGPFTVTDEVLQASKRTREAVQRLVEYAQRDGSLRPDVNAHDLVLLLHTLRELRAAHSNRDPALRQRFLGILLDGLRADNRSPLPAAPATWSDVERAWHSTTDNEDRAESNGHGDTRQNDLGCRVIGVVDERVFSVDG
ncbi:TetR/AcrR family transcriptional regulator [Micromonospora sp. LOL_023]|uniref:TetR/AcrR family transcriptional regulator n=1 Tax=Micromonospora sp. LOL_023 TaxID=3345418 RepID=UPI003A84D369